MGLLAFDRARLDTLRLALGVALADLRVIRSDDPSAADVMQALAGACRTIGDVWLPRVQDVLNSTSMTSCIRSAPGQPDLSQAAVYATTHDHGWETTTDPLALYGPPALRSRTVDDVLADVRSGVLVPMAGPLDAQGRSGATYTALSFAVAHPKEIGTKDMTSNALKVVDFISDGLPIGWREEQSLTIYYLTNARITSSVHVLGAIDRDEGPETLVDLTEEATASGYLIIARDSTTAEAGVDIGEGDDPTLSFPILSESNSSFTGAFYPDQSPVFQPVGNEARFDIPAQWTFTKSNAPMIDRWGTWEA